jgi:hypothetical protein
VIPALPKAATAAEVSRLPRVGRALAREALTRGIWLGKRGLSLACDQFTHVRAATVRTWGHRAQTRYWDGVISRMRAVSSGRYGICRTDVTRWLLSVPPFRMAHLDPAYDSPALNLGSSILFAEAGLAKSKYE